MRAVLVALAMVGALAVCLGVIAAAGVMSLRWADSQPPLATAVATAQAAKGGPSAQLPTNPAMVPVPPVPLPAPPPPVAPPPAPPADRPPPGPAVEITLGAVQAKVSGAHLMLVGAPAPADAADGRPADPPVQAPINVPPPDGGRRRSVIGLIFGGRPRQSEPYLTRWEDEEDAAEWACPVPAAGRYAVAVVYSSPFGGRMGRGRGPAGDPVPVAGTFVVTVGGQTATADALLGGAGRFGQADADAGTVDLPAGDTTVRVRLRPAADGDGRGALLAVRGVRLVRVE